MDFTVTVGSFGEPSVVKFLNGPYDGMYFIAADPGQGRVHSLNKINFTEDLSTLHFPSYKKKYNSDCQLILID